MRLIRIILLLLQVFLLSHCADLMQIVQKGGIEEPDVRISQTKLKSLTFDQADLVFDIEIKNPNPVEINLAGFDYDLLLNNISFLKGEQSDPMEIKANDVAIIQLPLSLLYDNIYKTYQRLKNEDNIKYNIEAGLFFNLPVLEDIRVPVKASGDFPAIKIPKVSLDYIKLSRLTLTGAEFILAMGVYNPNNFGFNINALQYGLSINQNNWADGQITERIAIQQKKDNTVIIPFKLNHIQIGGSIYQDISCGNDFDYQLNGKANLSSSLEILGDVDLPFELSGKIDLTN